MKHPVRHLTMKKRWREYLSQKGYALLGLIISLAIFAIFVTMTAQDQQARVQRALEAEFLHRGNAVAEGIARYNNGGRLGQLNPGGLFVTKLEDLKKGVDINGKLFHFIRPSALQDPMFHSEEWEPVRVGDPRIRQYLQEYAAYYRQPIPVSYQALTNSVDFEDEDDEDDDDDDDDDDNGGTNPTGSQGTGNFGGTGTGTGSQQQLLPIVGVISKSKKQAFAQQLGRDKKYNEMLFLYLPPPMIVPEATIPNGNGEQKN